MMDDRIILAAERLRDDLHEFKGLLRKRYPQSGRIVATNELKRAAARIAERWIVEIGANQELGQLVSSQYLGDMSVRFQRLLTFAEHATKRGRYDAEIKSILDSFTTEFIIPLKQARAGEASTKTPIAVAASVATGAVRLLTGDFHPTAFVAQSFALNDRHVNDCVAKALALIGITVVTGEKPKADRISEKIKRRIDEQYLFVGVFTRRDKIARKAEWTTSPWVIDEKAYASGKGKKLLLLKENGVSSIGGLQGDYEYIEFSRDTLEALIFKLLEMFIVKVQGLGE
jgi:hypothetical protein